MPVSVGNKYAYFAYSFAVNPIPKFYGFGKLELTSYADLHVAGGLQATGKLELTSTADLTVISAQKFISAIGAGSRNLNNGSSIDIQVPGDIATSDKLLAVLLHQYPVTPPAGWGIATYYADSDTEFAIPIEATVAFSRSGTTHYLSIFEHNGDPSDAGTYKTFSQTTNGRFYGQIVNFRREDGGIINIAQIAVSHADNTGSISTYPIAEVTTKFDNQAWTAWMGTLIFDNFFVDGYVDQPSYTLYGPTQNQADNRLIGAHTNVPDADTDFAPFFQQIFGVGGQGYGTIAILLNSDTKVFKAHSILTLTSTANLDTGNFLAMGDGGNVLMPDEEVEM